MKKLLLFLLLSGCAVGPNYQTPENSVCDAWQTDASVEEPLIAWWCVFEDPLLDHLIELAALQNRDIQTAESAIAKARAMRDVSASKLFPQITADLSYVKTYFSKNGPIFTFAPGGGSSPSSTTGLPFSIQVPQIQNLYNALFDASWEIDLFGKTRRAIESAVAHIQSAIDARNDILITVLSEVARAYIELRSFQQRVIYLERTVELYEENLAIATQQFKKGLINQLDLDTIASSLLSAEADLPDAIAEVYRSIYTLSLLTGNLPEALVDELFPFQPLPLLPTKIDVGLRSDLLRRRPDVREAERDLAAATADLGVAVAAFFPTFTLLGDGGFQSLHPRNLFSLPSRTWAWGADLNMPIFEGGKLFGNLHIAQAEVAMKATSYQQAVLTAVQEAETSLRAYREDEKTAAFRRESAEKLGEVALLTGARFDQGLVNKIALLNAERAWIAAEMSQLTSDTTALIDLVALYKALGGGWQPQGDCECE